MLASVRGKTRITVPSMASSVHKRECKAIDAAASARRFKDASIDAHWRATASSSCAKILGSCCSGECNNACARLLSANCDTSTGNSSSCGLAISLKSRSSIVGIERTSVYTRSSCAASCCCIGTVRLGSSAAPGAVMLVSADERTSHEPAPASSSRRYCSSATTTAHRSGSRESTDR